MTGPQKHVAIVGPTASGKSALAMAAAVEAGWEIVSVDSMQVYRGLDIGTAKATGEERRTVAHHMIDVIDPDAEMSVSEFTSGVESAIAGIEARGGRALLVGGTGLYLQAVVDGMRLPGRFPEVVESLETQTTSALYGRLQESDPDAASRIEKGNRRRLLRALEVTIGTGERFSSFGPGISAFPANHRIDLLGVWLPRSVLADRIDKRVDAMVAGGWEAEVSALSRRGPLSRTAAKALGYAEMQACIEGRMPLAEAKEEVKRKSRAFSRRQRVWFRRDPRIRWRATADDPRRLLPVILRDLARASGS